MPKTIQIRDLDDEVYTALSVRASEVGFTVPEFLRREATKLAARPSIGEWLGRTERRPSGISREQIIDSLDELRGAWPDAGR